MFRRLILPLLALALPARPAAAADWPQQMGPDRNGVAAGAGLATSFPDGRPPVAWRAVVGFGSAPPVVAGGRVYAFGLFKPGTAAADVGSSHAAPTLDDVAKGDFPSADLPGTPARVKRSDYPAAYRGDLFALCLNAADGKPVWATRLTDHGLAFKTTKHSSTGWEVASPLVAGGRLYVHTHTGRLHCLDAADGKRRWDVNLFDHRMSTWLGGQQGNSAGPLLVGGTVVVGYEGGAAADDPRPDTGCLAVAGFDVLTGAERWVTKAPFAGLNARTAALGLADLDGRPTVLGSCGGGTLGLDPATGKVLWSFDLAAANLETMRAVPEKYARPPKTAKAYRVDAMRPPFPGYAPVAWRNLVIDAATVGHNAATSATWCLKVKGGTATRVWQTGDFVPTCGSIKSNLVVRDGRLYGFDSYFPGFARQYPVTRPYRGTGVGEFQCRDAATGRLLWSSDAFNPEPPGPKRADSANDLFVLAGDLAIVCNQHGLWIGRVAGDGVTVLARVPHAARAGRMLGEPVPADGRLLIRQADADPKAGLLPAVGGGGNLICFDLRRP